MYIQDECINDKEFDNMADVVQKLNIQKYHQEVLNNDEDHDDHHHKQY